MILGDQLPGQHDEDVNGEYDNHDGSGAFKTRTNGMSNATSDVESQNAKTVDVYHEIPIPLFVVNAPERPRYCDVQESRDLPVISKGS
jgi:hypothetical protein